MVLHAGFDLLTRWPKPRFEPVWEKGGWRGMDEGGLKAQEKQNN
jgi:hypothetical protein